MIFSLGFSHCNVHADNTGVLVYAGHDIAWTQLTQSSNLKRACAHHYESTGQVRPG